MFKEKIKSYINKQINKDNKKNVENLVVFLVLLIITVIAINIIWGNEQEENKDEDYKVLAEDFQNNGDNLNENEYDLEDKLEDILSKIQGVGKTKVLITYSKTSSIVPIYSESASTTTMEETDSSGGTRKQETASTNRDVVIDGKNDVIKQTVVLPKVEGAIIIAEGGGNAEIKSNIIQAVAAVTGVATYKVQVFQMKD